MNQSSALPHSPARPGVTPPGPGPVPSHIARSASEKAPHHACYDVIVAGSGGAGLMGALRAALGGARVLLLEASPSLGGTTAMSGAGTWVPASRQALAAGMQDSPERALAYIHAVSPKDCGQTEAPLWQAFTQTAPEMLAFLEAHSDLRFALAQDPDPWPEAAEAMARGRMLSPRPLCAHVPGFTLQPPHVPHLLTYQEMKTRDPWHHPLRATLGLAHKLAWRILTGQRAQGTALIAGLARAALAAGVEIRPGHRVEDLLSEAQADGPRHITGVIATGPAGERLAFHTRAGVLLATGGFERDVARRSQHFAGPVDLIASSPHNLGDAPRMAQAQGAALAQMSEANIAPALPARLKGQALPVGTFHHHEPGAILVGPDGRRFANEYAANLGEILTEKTPTGDAAHLPCWMISDQATLARAPMLRYFLAQAPGWLRQAPDGATLAAKIGLDPQTLSATLARWNQFAQTREDPDFSRHIAPWQGPDSTRLRPLSGALIALPFNLTFLSTKGGPRTDTRARVLTPEGHPIPGLYCAGVAMANPFGTRPVGSGTTLGPNLTWGYIAGGDLLARLAACPPSQGARHGT